MNRLKDIHQNFTRQPSRVIHELIRYWPYYEITKCVVQGYDVENASPGINLGISDRGWTKPGVGQLWCEETFLKLIDDDTIVFN